MEHRQHYRIKDFEILIERNVVNNSEDFLIQPETDVIGFVYYLNGEVLITVKSGNQQQQFHKKKGMMSSFYSHNENEVFQKQFGNKSLDKISIFCSREKLYSLIETDEKITKANRNLIQPQDSFVHGKNSIIQPNISFALEQIIINQFSGVAKDLFLEGQIIGLLANYFSISQSEEKKSSIQIEKLHYAKEILMEQMDAPPSLTELSKLTGMNTLS